MRELVRSGFYKVSSDIVSHYAQCASHGENLRYVHKHSGLPSVLCQQLIEQIVGRPIYTKKPGTPS